MMGQMQANPGTENGNELTAIKGIGPARQQWFKEALNVATFEDLAGLSADEVEARFKAEGRIASRGEIEDWIAQARRRIGEAAQEPQVEVPGNSNPVKKREAAPKMDGWKPFASFVVEFRERQLAGQALERQTSVHHLESDTGQTWPGLENKLLCQWMVEQVAVEGEEVESESVVDEPVKKATPAGAPKAGQKARKILAELKVTEVRVYQPPESEIPVASGTAGEAFKGWVAAQAPFSLKASCELSGPGAAEATDKERNYKVLFFAGGLTGPDVQIGDSQAAMLTGEQTSYPATLAKVMLPSGLYHLRVVGKIEGAARLGYAQISGLQVR